MDSMDCQRLKRFYLANKAILDTRLDLAVTFLTRVTRLDQLDKMKVQQPKPEPPVWPPYGYGFK